MYRLLRPLLFLLPAETAHRLTLSLLHFFWRILPQVRLPPSLKLTVLGIEFESPIGLAAGMDKDHALGPAWHRLGFGFAEIGTVTPRPQPGNPRPRLFRLRPERAVINRMGFNNAGAAEVARRLSKSKGGVVAINVGRNKDTPNERAAEDYVAAFEALQPYAKFAVINVSSPNTPGLRALQDELGTLVAAVAAKKRIPVLVKLSPDESDERLIEMAKAAVAAGADGIVATNTTLERAAVAANPLSAEKGGLSGVPLKDRALAVCKLLYRNVPVPIIAAGGIATPEDVYARIRAGASLVEIYTSFIYGGPGLPRELARGLARLLERDGLTLQRALGIDA